MLDKLKKLLISLYFVTVFGRMTYVPTSIIDYRVVEAEYRARGVIVGCWAYGYWDNGKEDYHPDYSFRGQELHKWCYK